MITEGPVGVGPGYAWIRASFRSQNRLFPGRNSERSHFRTRALEPLGPLNCLSTGHLGQTPGSRHANCLPGVTTHGGRSTESHHELLASEPGDTRITRALRRTSSATPGPLLLRCPRSGMRPTGGRFQWLESHGQPDAAGARWTMDGEPRGLSRTSSLPLHRGRSAAARSVRHRHGSRRKQPTRFTHRGELNPTRFEGLPSEFPHGTD